jgi:hypothetical protein
MNNYPDTTIVELELELILSHMTQKPMLRGEVGEIECRCIVYGKEVGAAGTPHLQGAISFKAAKTLSAAIKALPGCHVELAKSMEHAAAYCKKDGLVTERGKPLQTKKEHGEAEQERRGTMRLAAEEGRFFSVMVQ